MSQFIPHDVIERAATREASSIPNDPLIMGVDVAYKGGDASVLAFRKGRDARILPWQVYREMDTMQLASRIAQAAKENAVDMVFIDMGAMGPGVFD